jgi:N-acyl-D-amino-acid deacylase
LIAEGGAVGMIDFIASEECISQALMSEIGVVCTDGLLLGSRPHPRSYGAFPRVLAKYVREEGALSLANAVRKMTGMPARILGLTDRGLLREGLRADITIFDAERVTDRATYMAPRQFPDGIPYVIVNGALAVDGGVPTGARVGQVLRREGERCR